MSKIVFALLCILCIPVAVILIDFWIQVIWMSIKDLIRWIKRN